MAPASAAASTISVDAIRSSASRAPTEAPDETPSTYGSARGFLSSACIMRPARASAPPVANATSARLARSSSREAESESGWPLASWRRASGISPRGTRIDPVMPANSRVAIENASMAPTMSVARWRSGGTDACMLALLVSDTRGLAAAGKGL